MEHRRFRWVVLILLALGAWGVSARASETPVYFVTEGSGHFDGDLFVWSFSGPGFSARGAVESACCRSIPVAVTDGFVFGFFDLFGSMSGQATVGGISYSINYTAPPLSNCPGCEGGVFISGSAALPNPPITIPSNSFFTVSGPASFTGSLSACTPVDECFVGDGTELFKLAFNNIGIAKFDLGGPIPSNTGPRYEVVGESFTVTPPTPEPETWLLYLTGLVMIGLVLWRKHQVLAVDGAPILRC